MFRLLSKLTAQQYNKMLCCVSSAIQVDSSARLRYSLCFVCGQDVSSGRSRFILLCSIHRATGPPRVHGCLHGGRPEGAHSVRRPPKRYRRRGAARPASESSQPGGLAGHAGTVGPASRLHQVSTSPHMSGTNVMHMIFEVSCIWTDAMQS